MVMNLNPRKLTGREQQAYELVEQMFIALLSAAMKVGINPTDLLEPYVQKSAALFATCKMMDRDGSTGSVDDLVNKLRIECGASIQRVMMNTGGIQP